MSSSDSEKSSWSDCSTDPRDDSDYVSNDGWTPPPSSEESDSEPEIITITQAPNKDPIQNPNGTYRRPRGAAPKRFGEPAMWDAVNGVWYWMRVL